MASILDFPQPQPFFMRKNFVGERGRWITGSIDNSRIKIHCRDPLLHDRYLSYLDYARVDRQGQLMGEYLVVNDFMLLDRRGITTIINTDLVGHLEPHFKSDNYVAFANSAVEHWDAIPVAAANAPIMSVAFSWNYYHYTLWFLDLFRRYENLAAEVMVVPHTCMRQPYQLELLKRAMLRAPVPRTLLRAPSPMEQLVKVVDPFVASTHTVAESVAWIRANMGYSASAGGRRVYVRRSGGRKFGGMVEDDAFRAILAEFGFETIEFGGGELSIDQQVRLLDGAGLILAAHGANLTNIIYLHGAATIVEILPLFIESLWPACYMEICDLLGFDYVGVAATRYDRQLQFTVDHDLLRQALAEACG